jgi:hypothetical protein
MPFSRRRPDGPPALKTRTRTATDGWRGRGSVSFRSRGRRVEYGPEGPGRDGRTPAGIARLRVSGAALQHPRKAWLHGPAAKPAMRRGPRAPVFRAPPADDEEIRKRRASANRYWTILRGALNCAAKEWELSDAVGGTSSPFARSTLPRADTKRVRQGMGRHQRFE